MRLKSLLALALGTVAALVLAEGILRLALPDFRGVVGGSAEAANAALYGWGFDPGHRHRMTDFAGGADLMVTMNSRGFKDRERQLAKPAGTRRIVLLGDSVTFGLMEIEAQLNVRLEEMLRASGCPVEVVAIAYGGWATDQQLVALEHEGLLYEPDVIVLQWNANDLEGIRYARDNSPPGIGVERNKPFRFTLEDGALRRVETPAPLPSIAERVKRPLRRLWLYRLVVTAKESLRRRPRTDAASPGAGSALGRQREAADWQLFEALLLEIRRVTEEAGAELMVFAEGPEEGLRQFYRRQGGLDAADAEAFLAPYHQLVALAERHDIAFAPIRSEYRRFADDFHPDREGTRAMARDLHAALIERPSTRARLCPPDLPVADG